MRYEITLNQKPLPSDEGGGPSYFYSTDKDDMGNVQTWEGKGCKECCPCTICVAIREAHIKASSGNLAELHTFVAMLFNNADMMKIPVLLDGHSNHSTVIASKWAKYVNGEQTLNEALESAMTHINKLSVAYYILPYPDVCIAKEIEASPTHEAEDHESDLSILDQFNIGWKAPTLKFIDSLKWWQDFVDYTYAQQDGPPRPRFGDEAKRFSPYLPSSERPKGQMGLPFPFNFKRVKLNVLQPGLPFCSLNSTIAQFYLDELEYHKNRKRFEYFDQYKKQAMRKFEAHARVLLKFALSALMGELRHTWRWETTSLVQKARNEIQEAYKELGLWKSQDNTSFYRQSLGRNEIYTRNIPENSWWKIYELCGRQFNAPFWGGSYGGRKWSAISYACLSLYESYMVQDMSMIILWFDRIVNLAHNCGLFLNKFDCHGCDGKQYKIATTLTAHASGDINLLKKYAIPSAGYYQGKCSRTIHGDNLGWKTKKEKQDVKETKKEYKELYEKIKQNIAKFQHLKQEDKKEIFCPSGG